MPTTVMAPRANRRPVEAAIEPPAPPTEANRGANVSSLALSGRATFKTGSDSILQTVPAAKLAPCRPIMPDRVRVEPSATVVDRRLSSRPHRGGGGSAVSGCSASRRTVGSSGPGLPELTAQLGLAGVVLPHFIAVVRFELLQLGPKVVEAPVGSQLGDGLGDGGSAGDGQWDQK